MKNKKYFLGWTNIRWVIIEIIKVYSSEKSFFSKKRIESGFAFMVAQAGMIFFLIEKYEGLTMGEFMIWAAAEFAVSGYIVNKIQSEKRRREDHDCEDNTKYPNPYYNPYQNNQPNYDDPSNYNPNDPNYYNPNDPSNYDPNDYYDTDNDPRKR